MQNNFKPPISEKEKKYLRLFMLFLTLTFSSSFASSVVGDNELGKKIFFFLMLLGAIISFFVIVYYGTKFSIWHFKQTRNSSGAQAISNFLQGFLLMFITLTLIWIFLFTGLFGWVGSVLD